MEEKKAYKAWSKNTPNQNPFIFQKKMFPNRGGKAFLLNLQIKFKAMEVIYFEYVSLWRFVVTSCELPPYHSSHYVFNKPILSYPSRKLHSSGSYCIEKRTPFTKFY
ncbi:EMI domain-containing protein 1 [Platysternon megacephalum]|uniref:EMI domain-containing protein 1 n=1 Tax=Platysternon megacephalum TaxID=55544 RepID=A0A4D9DX12_9SAUR|nr:EMI domain-containing protein 1 [Platysternon megacephalum]